MPSDAGSIPAASTIFYKVELIDKIMSRFIKILAAISFSLILVSAQGSLLKDFCWC